MLCIDGVEISTEFGHYVALGLPRTPYPLAGHPREVIEDVRRFGGFGIAAHPGSPNSELRWTDWDAPFDGLEWLNADSEWRDEFWTSLGRVLLTYAFRPVETLGGLLDRPGSVLAAVGPADHVAPHCPQWPAPMRTPGSGFDSRRIRIRIASLRACQGTTCPFARSSTT